MVYLSCAAFFEVRNIHTEDKGSQSHNISSWNTVGCHVCQHLESTLHKYWELFSSTGFHSSCSWTSKPPCLTTSYTNFLEYLQHILLYCYSIVFSSVMASAGPPIRNSETTLIHADGYAIPVSFPVGADGFCWVSALCLSLRFQFRKESMHIEEQVFNAVTGNLTHTVTQFSVVKDDDKLWLLKPGTYRAYGLSDSLPPISTELFTPRVSSTSTLPLPTRPMIKVEPGLLEITLLSDDSEDDLPSQVPSTKT